MAVQAGNGTRTRDPNLGKVVLYQLSYSRKVAPPLAARWGDTGALAPSGDEGNRTPDLLNAIQALSQLSYVPACRSPSQAPKIRHRQEPKTLASTGFHVKRIHSGAIR